MYKCITVSHVITHRHVIASLFQLEYFKTSILHHLHNFQKSVNVLICAVLIVSSIGPQSLFFSPTRTEHAVSHTCFTKSFFLSLEKEAVCFIYVEFFLPVMIFKLLMYLRLFQLCLISAQHCIKSHYQTNSTYCIQS